MHIFSSRILSIIVLIFCCVFGTPMLPASASMPVPVYYESLMDGKKEVGAFSLAAVRIVEKTEPVLEDDIFSFGGFGHNDHSVDIITFGVIGWEKKAAAGNIVLKCYEEADCMGTEYETIQQELRSAEGERLDLKYRYSYRNTKARSVLVELTYTDSGPDGTPREYRGNYKINIR